MIKIIDEQQTRVAKYGRIKVETRIGELEYSFCVNGEDDNPYHYQLESSLSNFHELTMDELNEIDDLIMERLIKY